MTEFTGFPKIPRLSRPIVVTEKIDGTNGQIFIDENKNMFVGSRKRWISIGDDNYGFAAWAEKNKEELIEILGPGRHFGEWWGNGINRGYGLPKGEKRFSLFNVSKWGDGKPKPSCCYVVPVLGFCKTFDTDFINDILMSLEAYGSIASPGFMQPEGVIIYHTTGNLLFKKTILKDEHGKGE